MKDGTKEHWMKLCKQAAMEHDPQKLRELVEQINELLERKERRPEVGSGERQAKPGEGEGTD